MSKKNNFHVFFAAIAIISLFVIWGILDPTHLAVAMQDGLTATISYFGWLYLMSMFGFLLFSMYLAFGPFGDIRLGGRSAKPDFSRRGWFSMLFAAGMGIGLVFWGAAEPISHFNSPPQGLTSQSPEAARAALRYTFFHWGFHPWAAYCVVAISLAFMQFNRNKPILISSVFDSLLGRTAGGWTSKTIDVFALIATAFGVATSLGFGALQIGAGLNHLFGVSNDLYLHLGIISIASVMYLASALSGLTKGILLLSNLNMMLAVFLMASLFVIGPTAFILDSLTTTLGDYFNNLISMSMRMTPFSRRDWVANWTLFYWAWWIAWAPFVGLFIARISRGRTLREFVVGVLLLPSLASFLWFSVFGGIALWQAMFAQVPLIETNSQDVSMTLFVLLENLPLGMLTSIIAIFLVIVFFVTSADSATLVLAMLSSNGDPNPKNRIKLTWGISMAIIAAVLLVSGGLKGLQTMSILSALPFMILMIIMCVCLYRELRQEVEKQVQHEEAKDRLLEKLLKEEKSN